MLAPEITGNVIKHVASSQERQDLEIDVLLHTEFAHSADATQSKQSIVTKLSLYHQMTLCITYLFF